MVNEALDRSFARLEGVLRRRPALRNVLQITIDAMVAAGALSFAIVLKFGGWPGGATGDTVLWLVPAVTVGRVAVNFGLGHYRQIWHYTSLREAVGVCQGAVLASAALGLCVVAGLIALPLSVVAIDAAFYILGAVGARGLRRMQVRRGKSARHRARSPGVSGEQGDRVLIVGAGDTAESLLRDYEASEEERWRIVGLLDDDPSKQGTRMRGHPVIGPTTRVEDQVRSLEVSRVVIAMPAADATVVEDVARRARRAGATVQTVPAIKSFLDSRAQVPEGTVTLEDLRDVEEVRETLLGVRDGSDTERPVLVTGGAGYIGSHLVRRLLEEGHRVRVLDSFVYGRQGLAEVMDHDRLEIVEGDICNVRHVVNAVKDVDCVVALAAIVGDPACGLDAEATLNLNYESTKILVEACNFYQVERLVFASTCSVYGAADDELLTERSNLNPVSLYARTRIMSEDVILERTRGENSVEPVILRLATVFGYSPRMRFDLVVNTLTVRGVVDGKFQIFGGEQWRPFVHCRDAAEAFYRAASAPLDVVGRETFNVGSTEMNYQISRIGEIVADEVGEVEVEHAGEVEDPRNYRVSFDKIEREIGFEPSWSVRSGVKEMAERIRREEALREYQRSIYSNFQFLEDRFTDVEALLA